MKKNNNNNKKKKNFGFLAHLRECLFMRTPLITRIHFFFLNRTLLPRKLYFRIGYLTKLCILNFLDSLSSYIFTEKKKFYFSSDLSCCRHLVEIQVECFD